MQPTRTELVAELAAQGRAHDAALEDRLQRLRNVEPETAAMLGVLVRGCGAQSLLEIGTSNGYSTIWLADAAEANGGRLLSVDIDRERSAQAKANLDRAGLEDVVELRVEDAARTLAELPDASIDFAFLDAERPAYCGYWEDLLRVLSAPALLTVDNATSHAHELSEFLATVKADERVSCALVPVGAGVLLIAR
jgi:predicted O-methyltransferase YrrM